MYTAEMLRDVHERAHRSLQKLMEHCRELSADQLNRKLDGFGYGSIQLQLHHVIGAEQYWIGVLQGRVEADENDEAYPTIDALEAYRARVAAVSRDYLASATPEELNTTRRMMTWGGNERDLTPALVVLRPLTHIYNHQGQVAAMCRLMGKPVPPGLDFPIT